MMPVPSRALIVVLVLFSAALCRAEVYRWVDDQGQTHFADQPQGREPHAIAVRPRATGGQDPRQRMDKTRRLLNAFEIERQQKREQREKDRQQGEQRRRNCMLARDSLRQYRESGNIYRLDSAGNRVYLSDQERVAAIERNQQAVADWCD